ncbi:mitochondrial carnitine/acylcarnitine carrier protein [Eurytemora carolleeae]|uniref:mitochondrial carnitine/acylcarnitine carrier protein n=1 Tax=Eurytemora carolleeae TaxID=1294199 RepID=UPI000C7734ED|nr:mitochondrial carnitine/acylcarnitine carrier protein [Eurytemora carolleeae]|eukprot:XP_023347945.1 mitochondrial carnitine/acylcarnitine carrier protein-like [Eurytemora affinis]
MKAVSTVEKNGRAEPVYNLIAGGVSGLLSLTVGHPFDTVKVRLQTMKPVFCYVTGVEKLPYSSGLDCLRKCIVNEGFPSLYRGMGALALFSLPRFSIMFYTNSWGRIFGKKIEEKCTQPGNLASSDQLINISRQNNSTRFRPEFSTTQILTGTIISQLVVVPLIVNPLERVKVILQTCPEHKGQLDCFKHILRSEGVQGLFRGTTLTLARDIPGFATYFLVYEHLRTLVRQENTSVSLTTTAFIGGLAGMIAWSVQIPVDNLKNRLQASKDMGGVRLQSALKKMYLEGGISQLYRGSAVVLLRAFPANAATFVGYEWTIQLLQQINRNNL